MTGLTWDSIGSRDYEVGVDHAVLYPQYLNNRGVAWNGLVSVDETPSGGTVTSFYYNGIKYLDVPSVEDYQATLTAFMYPDEFIPLDGGYAIANGLYATAQVRSLFGLCYRTKLGNDLVGDDAGYKLHLVYNVIASPSDKNNQTQDDSPSPINFQWTLNAVPPLSSTYKPTAHLIVNSTEVSEENLSTLEAILYGSDSADPRFPTQEEVITILTEVAPEDIITEPIAEPI